MDPHTPVVFALLSPWQLLIVATLVILLFGGSKRIPELMRSLGRSVTEFKKGIADSGDEEEEAKKKIED